MSYEKPGSGTNELDPSGTSPGHASDSLVQSIDGIVWEAEADTFRFTFVNDQAERILGYSVKRWLTEPDFWVNHVHPGDREWVVDFCIDATKRRENHQFEYRMIAADSRIVWFRDVVTVNIAEDQSVCLRGVMIDVTERVEAVNALVSSEMQTRLFLEQMPAIAWSTDSDLRFTQMAGKALASLRMPDGRTVGVSLYEYFQTDDPAFKPIAAHLRVLSGESQSYEFEWMERTFTVYVEPLRNAVGEIVGCVGIALDITERKLAEEELRRVSERLKLATRSANIGIWDWDVVRDELIWDDAMYRLFGIDKKDFSGAYDAWANSLAPEDFERASSEVQAALRGEQEFNCEFRIAWPDCSVHFIKARSQTFRDEAGRPVRMIGVNYDITARKQAEEKMRLSEERLRLVLDSTAEGIFGVDLEGRCTFCNAAGLRLLGYDQPSDLAGKDVHALIAHSRADGTPYTLEEWPAVLSLKNATDAFSDDDVFWRRDGTSFPAEYWSYPMYREGRHIGAVVTFLDITERKRAEDALRQSQRRFSDTLTNLEMFAVMTDAVGNITFCNDYLLRLTGWEREEAIGRNWFEMFLPEREKEKVKEILQASPPDRSVIPHFENEIVTRSGKRRLVKWTNTTLRDSNGRIVGVAALGDDITERKYVEQQLIKSEESYRDLVENALDIIYTHDLEGNYTSINKAGNRITGYTREEALNLNLAQTVASEFLEKARRMIANKLAGEEETAYDLEIVAKDGHRIAVEVNTRLIVQEGVPVGIQGIARDVTERRQLEEQLRQSQKLESIGQLAGGIAHDFNNMLTAINGYSDLILRMIGKDDPLRSKVEEIKKAGERSASLTQQLLAFSRKQVMRPKVLDLNVVVSDMESMLQRLIGENIDLQTMKASNLGSVKADPGQIEQVILNLVVNARDAMPRGGKLTIETENVNLDKKYVEQYVLAKQGSYVRLAVTDDGIGMDDESRRHIFEPFYTTKELGKGTGLGLATVYGIVKQSNGYISVDSEPGRGTTIHVYLPLVDEGAQEYKRSTESEVSFQGSETILLIEDEEIVRNLTRELLTSYGYHVLEAAAGQEGLLICEHYDKPIHLLITDVVMPGLSGPELANALSEVCRDMKVLYISGYTDDAIAYHGILNSDIDFLQKPFTPEALARKVREVLDKDEK